MVFGRTKRRETDALRAKFVANRETVRSWTARWECPEVEWPPFDEVPGPWVVAPRERKRWLEQHAPFLDTYRWLLEARPVAGGVNQLVAEWEFGAGHEFQQLTIRFRSVLDPDYLAEKLALGIHAAALKGWQDDDVHDLYDWLLEGVNQCVGAGGVRAQYRTGFLLTEMSCGAVGPKEVITTTRTSLTDTALGGAPLNSHGSA
ncbi:hypothetical protein ACFW4X_17050 [Streptomyces smyrnaeus]|uniref:hypothetical protein n=1 Tax=Streptomyces smyrnaeus TaxID=1387713 RepID=UPI0036C326AD